jgi:hypothetical protein
MAFVKSFFLAAALIQALSVSVASLLGNWTLNYGKNSIYG